MRPLFVVLCVFLVGSEALFARGQQLIYAFRNYTRPEPIRMILVGEISSKIKVAEVYNTESPYRGYDTRADQITVNVSNRKGLKVGQKLFVIDKDPFHSQFRNGLVVGEIVVTSILYSTFYGWVLTGTGNLLRVREGQFVARTLESENLERARTLKKKGDHYYNRGQSDRAIASYNAALEADKDLPDAHAALGRMYLDLARKNRAVPVRALAEFQAAWKSRANFRHKYETFAFYKNYLSALHFAYDLRRVEASREFQLGRLLERSVAVAAEARKLDPKNRRIARDECRAQFHLMRRFRDRGSPDRRDRYEAAHKRTGELLFELLPGSRDAEVYRIGVLYYYYNYQELAAARTPQDLKRRDDLLKRVRYYLSRYALYFDDAAGSRDAEVERIRRALTGNRQAAAGQRMPCKNG